MLSFFFKKDTKIRDLLMKHLDAVIECYTMFTDGLGRVWETESEEELVDIINRVSAAESNADGIRHKIIQELLSGALLPESRREILMVIEEVDKVANAAEDIIKRIVLECITIDTPYKSSVLLINEKTKGQLGLLRSTIDGMLSNLWEAYKKRDELIEIDTIEHEIDLIEFDLVRRIFKSDMELAEKMQLKSVVVEIAKVSNIVEDISDILERIMVSRKV
ncbi:phosphate transport regulator [Peptoclostridium acidaminophilum DSM 3953]|uniref:Phosphate transport regulator n=1 Tax=Peptoclostridium acidaminophilum DSM 3953 TaxID=1286171 RepID=W8TG88_PEPAC|nr:DUF47 family protein [Peptoclostridium acidaminophilum]AHM56848.1 phosphate transport regulator [Peptoclostridium acidaminophilum DSM 3953]